MPGTSIVLKDKSVAGVANTNGDFELIIPSTADSVLVSFIGFQTQTLKINSAVPDFQTITMIDSNMATNCVVVAGGAFVRRSFTGRLWYKIKRIF